MEEVNNPPHSMGSGQPHQHPVNHTRPFFYVQPPSQPYYMYQWHMNNPYGHYGFPGSGLPFGRPYMAPYPYMQYPGYVIPHAPVQPIDYRRMFNPHFASAAAYDVRFRHHQARMRRETACSEAQTEPSDAVNKLIESLDKLKTHDTISEKELDSGVVSQNSGVFLPGGEPKHEGQSEDLEPLPTKTKLEGVSLPTSAALFSKSAVAVYETESSRSHFEELAQQEGWSVGSDGVLPLDSSSIHEESGAEKEDEFALHCVPEKLCLSSVQADNPGNIDGKNHGAHGAKIQSEVVQGLQPGNLQNCEGPLKKTITPSWPSPEPSPSQLSNQDEGTEHGRDDVSKMPQPGSDNMDGGKDVPEKPALDFEDLPYRILRLPCDKLTTTGLLQKDSALWYMDSLSTLIPPHTYLSSFGNAYYYSYYPPTAQERQSVLSPSLDELSSRDEMFSTDLEDVDFISSHVYTGGRLAEAPRETPDPAGEGNVQTGSFQGEECLVCPKVKMCATCGSCLPKETKRGKAHPLVTYDYRGKDDSDDAIEEDDEDDDDDDDSKMLRNTSEPRKILLKRPPHSKKHSHLPPVRQVSKQKSRKGYCEEPDDPVCLEEQDLRYPGVVECCEEHKAMAKAEKYKGQEPRNAHSRPHSDRQCREGNLASDQESWDSCGVKIRSKAWKPYPVSRGPEKSSRKTSCKTFVCQRSRRTDYDDNEEGDFAQLHRGRGSTKRRHKMLN